MQARSLKKVTFSILLFISIVLMAQACQQKYWFRKKVGDHNSNDSGEVDKDYKIIW